MANDININESAILETINAKIDYDGGNYPSSGLEAQVNKSRVAKSGDTMTGYLTTINNLYPFIAQSNVLDITSTPSAHQYLGYDYRDKNGTRIGWAGVVNHTNGTKYFQIQNLNGVSGFEFPKCTTKATTTSSAANHKVAVITQNYCNGTSWYRVWSDGWCEQGGATTARDTTVTFLKPFTGEYNITATTIYASFGSDYALGIIKVSNSQARLYIDYGGSYTANSGTNWRACGYIN